MKNLVVSLRVAFMLTLPAIAVRGQAPPNDNFFNAIPINGPIATVTGSNVGASKNFGQNGEPFLIAGNFGGASVWWSWVATASGPTTIDTMGSDFNTILGIFTGSQPNQLTSIAENDNFEANTWSRVMFNAIAGTNYRIYVDGFRSGGGPFGQVARGNIVLNVKGVGGLELSITNGMVFTVGDPIPVNVSVTPDFPNPPATRVDFFRRSSPFVAPVQFASVTTPPFSAVATNVPAGSNNFYVVVFDSLGNPVQSPDVSLLVQNVGVTLVGPFEDAMFGPSNPIVATAWAYLPGGTITNIEFLLDGVKYAEDDAPPYSGLLTNATGGSHRLTAVGRSDTGARFTSQPVNFGVVSAIVPWGAVWKYLDDGSDQGTNWTAPYFDDSAWKSGPAELGYGDGDEATVVEDNGTPGYTQNANDRFITTYFRRRFELPSTAGLANIALIMERDDGAVVHLNGQELFRSPNMPQPPTNITYLTLTSDPIGIEDTIDTVILNPTNLLSGSNLFAVEIHQQAQDSSDISFNLQLLGIPVIIHNLSPIVELTNPPANSFFLAPASIDLGATAQDYDGTVTKVEFFADGVKIGEDDTAPYAGVWNNPSFAAHVLTAVATDDQGATTTSAEIPVVVYDADGTPVAAITSPADGFVTQGPTNWLVTATAHAITGVTNVEFFNNGVSFGNDATAPYSALWVAPFGTNLLTAVASDASGVRGTSPVIVATITIPPTNVIAPTVFSQTPLAGATVTNLTTLTVIFSENVQSVDASDLLINGVPATSVSANHSTSNYTFTFPQPPYGAVNVSWAMNDGITDYGWPTLLDFDGAGPGATWSYNLIDRTPPVVASRTPAAGSTVTNLTQISVTFSEPVTGVDASDLLLNGVPALNVSGGGASYTFAVVQPPPGTNNVTWAVTNGITDLAVMPNPFNRSNTVNNWSYILDTRVALVQSNSFWLFIKGTNEASEPKSAWRQLDYDASGWSNAPAPFFYGESSLTNANIAGTTLSDMQSNYTSLYLRKEFTVLKRGDITNVLLNAQVDDGFIAWINGVEVARVLMPTGEVAFSAVATAQANEPNNNGAAYVVYTLTNALRAVVDGRNVLAVHAFNQNLTNSSDFSFNAQLYYFPLDPNTVPPRLLDPTPPQGDVFALTNVLITFSEPVTGVHATDLLVNGTPATGLVTVTNTAYAFSFPQPPYGNVVLSWATNHGIADFDNPPKSFIGTNANAILRYFLINPSNPKIASQVPAAFTTITGLTSIAVTFTEPVSGVNASDLLVAGAPASGVSSADGITHNFTFGQPPFGNVTIRWATNHGIVDVEAGNGFDPTRFGGQWNYTLIDPVPSVTITSPTNNTFFLPPASVTLRATASDNDGTVALVEFYQNASKLGESPAAPYTLGVSNLLVGSYAFTAVATDNQGLSRTSAPSVINVVTSLPITIVRGPYLQIGSTTGAVVRWRTQVPSDAVLRYGPNPYSLTNIAFVTTYTNEQIITLTGLKPDTKYYYSAGNAAQTVVGGDNSGEDYWFKTSPEVGTRRPYRLWVLGDCGTAGRANGTPDVQASTRDAFYNFAATNGQPDLWLMLGDNAYETGTDVEHQRAIFDLYPTTLRNKFLWTVLGNHETAQSTTAASFPYLDIFSLPKEGEAGGVPSGDEKYYSFDYGNIHFVALDSMTSGRTADTPMADWLRADLEATTAEWIIAFFHHPPYTKGNHDSDREADLISIRQNLLPILEANGVDLVLNGHSHAWERSYLLNGHYGNSDTLTDSMKIDGGNGREDGDGAYHKNPDGEGVVYTVAGNAGQVTGGSLDHAAHFLSLNELGTMVIDVSGNRLDAILLRETGEIRDRFTITKPPPYPLPPKNLLAVPTGANEITLYWTAGSTNHLGFTLERSIDGVNFTQILALPPEANNALDTALLANATYFYRARATNTFGASDWSNIASASTVMPTSAPRAPAGLAASADDGFHFFRSRMVLTWQDRSTNEAAFQVERSSDGAAYVPVATVAANLDSFIDEGLDSATLYFYRVRSLNALGLSAPSNLAGDQTHPQNQFGRVGDTVSFHAGPEGTGPVSYQWRFNGVGIPGATSETLVLNNVQLAAEGEYAALVRDATGALITKPGYLIVVAPPQIVGQPPDTLGIAGRTLSLAATAAGTEPMTYQWRKNGLSLSGANNPALALPGVQVVDSGGYDLVVENDFGSATSRVAAVSIYVMPELEPVPDIYAEVLRTLGVSNFVHDANQPPLQLMYSLAPGAPTNSRIHALTGRFSWTPTRSQAPGTYPITVRIVDPTRHLLSNEMTFRVIVNDYVETTVGSAALLVGTNGFVPLDFFSSTPLSELHAVVQLPGAKLRNLSVDALAPALATVTLQSPDSNTAAITIAATAGNQLQGTQALARLTFFTPAGQTSSFAPIHLESVMPILASPGPAPTILANHGRAAIIGTQPLIDARLTNGARELVIYGRVGTTYHLQYATNLANPTWTLRSQFTFTNISRSFFPANIPPTNRPAYFRARQP